MPVFTRAKAAQLLAPVERKCKVHNATISLSELHGERVAAAAAAVFASRRYNHLSYRQAALHYKVSTTTILNAVKRLRAGRDPHPTPRGAIPALTVKEENFLLLCIHKFAAQAMCLSMYDLQKIVDHMTVGPRVCYSRRRLVLTDK